MGTLGRSKEINEFLDSLIKQDYNEYELIIVDQNDDDRVDIICQPYNQLIDIKIIKTSIKGLSKARNLGMKYVNGDIIAFPDDDCVYPPKLLHKIKIFFKMHPSYRILTTSAIDKLKGKHYKWFWPYSMELKEKKILRMATSFGIFVKKHNNINIQFDEQFGVGSLFGAAEEVDYLLKLLNKGYKGYYERNLFVFHRERAINNMTFEEVFNYSVGVGALIKKHLYYNRKWFFIEIVLKQMVLSPLKNIFFALLILNKNKMKWAIYILRGKVAGFNSYKKLSHKESQKFD